MAKEDEGEAVKAITKSQPRRMRVWPVGASRARQPIWMPGRRRTALRGRSQGVASGRARHCT
eukprot:8243674-Lingulodinium_polyedra.AAC.1